jgi:hypothetical protein
VSLLVKSGSHAGPARHRLIDRGPGGDVLAYPALDVQEGMRGEWIRGLAVANGRLLVETSKGLLCMRGPM